MKILFICPSSETPFKQEDSYPLGLAYLASVLENKGHEVIVKDYFTEAYESIKENILKEIEKNLPEVIGLSCVTMNKTACFRLARIIRKKYPKIKIIMGGIHATSLYEQILLNIPIDIIVMGEGEVIVPNLLEALDKNGSLKNVKGIAFKEKDKVYFTGYEDAIIDIDKIPFPKHELFKEIMKKSKTALMITSRGCPYGCIFCSTSNYWGRKWRPRSAKNVVDEIEYIVKNFQYVKKLFFHDDTFTLDNQRVIDICNMILKKKIKIEWVCSGRIDLITKDMLKKMKQAGCTRITYGVESGSSKILKTIDKQITREHILNAIKLTNEVGLDYRIYLMVGNPGETWDTIKETTKFLEKLKNLKVEAIGRLSIFPNTKVYEIACEQGIIDDSYWLTEKKVPIYTYEHSSDELTKMAYYIIAKNQLHQGLFNFIIFALKFFKEKPKKAIRFILLRLHLMKPKEVKEIEV